MTVLGFQTIQLIGLAINVILPIAIDLVTKASWPGGLRATLNAALTVLIGFGSTAIVALNNNAPWDWQGALVLAFTGWCISTAMYFKAWKGSLPQAYAQNSLIRDKNKYDIAA